MIAANSADESVQLLYTFSEKCKGGVVGLYFNDYGAGRRGDVTDAAVDLTTTSSTKNKNSNATIHHIIGFSPRRLGSGERRLKTKPPIGAPKERTAPAKGDKGRSGAA